MQQFKKRLLIISQTFLFLKARIHQKAKNVLPTLKGLILLMRLTKSRDNSNFISFDTFTSLMFGFEIDLKKSDLACLRAGRQFY